MPAQKAIHTYFYCVCRAEYGTKEQERLMIQCDVCGEWYHHDCVGIPVEEAKNIIQYDCAACSGDWKDPKTGRCYGPMDKVPSKRKRKKEMKKRHAARFAEVGEIPAKHTIYLEQPKKKKKRKKGSYGRKKASPKPPSPMSDTAAKISLTTSESDDEFNRPGRKAKHRANKRMRVQLDSESDEESELSDSDEDDIDLDNIRIARKGNSSKATTPTPENTSTGEAKVNIAETEGDNKPQEKEAAVPKPVLQKDDTSEPIDNNQKETEVKEPPATDSSEVQTSQSDVNKPSVASEETNETKDVVPTRVHTPTLGSHFKPHEAFEIDVSGTPTKHVSPAVPNARASAIRFSSSDEDEENERPKNRKKKKERRLRRDPPPIIRRSAVDVKKAAVGEKAIVTPENLEMARLLNAKQVKRKVQELGVPESPKKKKKLMDSSAKPVITAVAKEAKVPRVKPAVKPKSSEHVPAKPVVKSKSSEHVPVEPVVKSKSSENASMEEDQQQNFPPVKVQASFPPGEYPPPQQQFHSYPPQYPPPQYPPLGGFYPPPAPIMYQHGPIVLQPTAYQAFQSTATAAPTQSATAASSISQQQQIESPPDPPQPSMKDEPERVTVDLTETESNRKNHTQPNLITSATDFPETVIETHLSEDEISDDFPALEETDITETQQNSEVVLEVPKAQPPPPPPVKEETAGKSKSPEAEQPPIVYPTVAERFEKSVAAGFPDAPPGAKQTSETPQRKEKHAHDSDDMDTDSSDDENIVVPVQSRKRPLSQEEFSAKKRKFDPSSNKMKLKIRNKSRKLLQPSAKSIAATMEDYIYKRHSSNQNWDESSLNKIGDLRFKGPCLPHSKQCYVYKVNDCLSRFKNFPFLVTLLTQELLSYPDLLNMSENEISQRRSHFEAEIKLECQYSKYFEGSISSKLVGTINKYYQDTFHERGENIGKILAAHPRFADLVPDKLTLKKLVTTDWTDFMVKEFVEKYGSESPKKKSKEKKAAKTASKGKAKVDYSGTIQNSEASGEFILKLKQLGGLRFPFFPLLPKELEMTGRMGYSDLEKHLNKLRKSTSRQVSLFHAYVAGEEGVKFVKYLKKLKRIALFKLKINRELYHLYIIPNPTCFSPKAFQKIFKAEPKKMWACIDFPKRKKKEKGGETAVAKKKLAKLPDMSKKGLTEESVSSLLTSLSDLMDSSPPKRSFTEAIHAPGELEKEVQKVRSPPRDPRLPEGAASYRQSPINPHESPLHAQYPAANAGIQTYPPPDTSTHRSKASPGYPRTSSNYDTRQKGFNDYQDRPGGYGYGRSQYRQARRRPKGDGREDDRRDNRQQHSYYRGEYDDRYYGDGRKRDFHDRQEYGRRGRFGRRPYDKDDEDKRWKGRNQGSTSGGFSL